jgi:squalene synthase HpnC
MGIDHYENFPVASFLLPKRLRSPVKVIYQFARSADDIADEGIAPRAVRLEHLAHLRSLLEDIAQGRTPSEVPFDDLAEVIRHYRLPLGLFFDLLEAFAQDVTKTRYVNFDEVLDYCRRSANPIGRLLLHLFGRTEDHLLQQSDSICSSLQLINFLQDIEVDYQKGRIYIPLDEMKRYHVTEEQIARRDLSGGWIALMQQQVRRASDMLNAGAPLGRVLPGRIGLELRMTIAGGRRILAKLLAVNGDVFHDRPALRAWDWPLMFCAAALPN